LIELPKPATSKLGKKYGLRPIPDGHPFLLRALRARVGATHAAAPAGFSCDYESMLRPVRDQGQEGSCGPHAWCGLKEANCVRWALLQSGWQPGQPLPATLPKLGDWLSVAHFYWNVLKAEGVWPNDEGTDNATAGAVAQGVGACPESFLPYVPGAMQPGNAQCDAAGAPYRIHQAVMVPLDAAHLDAVLYSVRCMVLGFAVYESFEETGPDGVVPPLKRGEGLLGGHDVLICGKRADGLYKVRNSWSTGWGDGGYFYVSAAYLQATGWDCWAAA